VPPPRSRLPDALVWRAPRARHRPAEAGQHLPARPVQPAAPRDVSVRRFHHLAVHVELQLPGGAVARPDRPGALVAFQVTKLPFLETGPAVHVVQDLKPRPRQARGVQEPGVEGLGLRGEAHVEEGAQGERRVPQPAVPVVPVPVAPDGLGQRGGWRGHDRAGRRKGHELEHERAAKDGLPVRALVREAARPVLPPPPGQGDRPFGIAAHGRDHRRHVPVVPQDHEPPVAGAETLTPAKDGAAAGPQGHLAPEGDGLRAPGAEDGRRACSLDSRGTLPVSRPGIEQDLHLDLALDHLDPPDDLVRGPECGFGRLERRGHRIREARPAGRRGEGRLQDVRAGEVAAGDRADLARGPQGKSPAPRLVEDRCEDRGTVEAGQAEPVDGAIAGHQGGRAAVANHGVVADGAVGGHSIMGPRAAGTGG